MLALFISRSAEFMSLQRHSFVLLFVQMFLIYRFPDLYNLYIYISFQFTYSNLFNFSDQFNFPFHVLLNSSIYISGHLSISRFAHFFPRPVQLIYFKICLMNSFPDLSKSVYFNMSVSFF